MRVGVKALPKGSPSYASVGSEQRCRVDWFPVSKYSRVLATRDEGRLLMIKSLISCRDSPLPHSAHPSSSNERARCASHRGTA